MSGSAGPLSSEARMIAVRLTVNGTLDGSFGSGGRVRVDGLTSRTDEAYYDGRLAIAPDGDIYLFNGTQDSGGVIGWVLARVNPNGTLDGGFASGGRLTAAGNTLEAGDVAVQADGKALLYEDYFDTAPTPDNQQTRSAATPRPARLDGTFGSGGAPGGLRPRCDQERWAVVIVDRQAGSWSAAAPRRHAGQPESHSPSRG
jgi:hypothetical protein